MNKVCSLCNINKSSELFYKARYSKDGLSSSCKECQSLKSKQRRDLKREIRDNYKIKHETKKHVKKGYNPDVIKVRIKKSPELKMVRNLRTRLLRALKKDLKTGSAIRDLGCSIKELKSYLEKQFYPHIKTGKSMTWDNYGRKDKEDCWEIDHIIPFCALDLRLKENIILVCNYKNLRPLWRDDHKQKSIEDSKLSLRKILK